MGTGTSQGIPVIACTCKVCGSTDWRDKRSRTSVMVETKETTLVVDTGADFRMQMLRERVSRVDAVLFTHEHKDHTAGLDDIRSYNHKHNMDMPIYAQERVLAQLRQEFAYIFAEHKYPGVPRVMPYSIEPYNELNIGGISIMPVLVMHYKLPILGYIFNDRIAYITDAKTLPDDTKKLLRGIDHLVVNALHHEEHISHFNLQEALQTIEELKPGHAYLTHMSHNMGFHRVIQDQLPAYVTMAYDGLTLSTEA